MAFLFALSLMYALIPSLVVSSSSSLVPRNNAGKSVSWSKSGQTLCTVLDGRAALIGNQIFFMGANYTTITGDPIAPQQVLFALNLNESFAVNQLLNPALYQSALPSGVPFVYTTGGLFWHDNTTLYLYNDVGERQKSDGIRVFDVLSGTWRSTSVSGGNFQAVFDRGIGGYASIPGRGLSFYTGGAQNATTGLIRFNSANQEELSWTNETASTLYTGRSEGQMAYVPVGADGILLYMGGYNTSHVGSEYGTGWPYDDSLLSTVSVYDIASKQWYRIQTTGDIPPNGDGSVGMNLFCHWVTPAPDGSSFQITIYGGWSLSFSQAFETTYVLSIPSFRWIQMNSTNNLDMQNGAVPGRQSHRCYKWKDDHGFVLGGLIRNGSDGLNLGNGTAQNCNPNLSPLRLLNLSTFEWQSSFDHTTDSAAYTVHRNISNVIGGGPKGKATATAPSGGWSNQKLASIFSKRPPAATAPTNIFAVSSTPGNGAGLAFENPKKIHTGAIAGGVVGGVVGAALIAGMVYFFFIRPRQRKVHELDAAGKRDNTTADPYYKAELDASGQRQIYEADATDASRKPELQGSPQLAELQTQEASVELYAGPQSPVRRRRTSG